MQKLPIGIQTFSSIREENYVYIDKTPLIWEMVQGAGRYFLSRLGVICLAGRPECEDHSGGCQ